ncbi:MAG: hypothetical protein JJV96_02300 [Alphaproteobacteria bacterium]|nr:hypothetical protein [Alphaproteobacteria bacterium]
MNKNNKNLTKNKNNKKLTKNKKILTKNKNINSRLKVLLKIFIPFIVIIPIIFLIWPSLFYRMIPVKTPSNGMDCYSYKSKIKHLKIYALHENKYPSLDRKIIRQYNDMIDTVREKCTTEK